MTFLPSPGRDLTEMELRQAEFGGFLINFGLTQHIVTAGDHELCEDAVRQVAHALSQNGSRRWPGRRAGSFRVAAYGRDPVRLWLMVDVADPVDGGDLQVAGLS